MGSKDKIQLFRIIEIDKKIRSEKYPNAVSLSKELEYSERTIKRDIEYMKSYLSAPIEYDYLKRGYYYTKQSFFLPAMQLSEKELFSMFISAQVLQQYENTPLHSMLKTVFDKLTTFLPDTVSIDPKLLSNTFSVIPESRPIFKQDIWETVFTALSKRKELIMEYRTPGKPEAAKRTVCPYHIVCYMREWYFAAKDNDTIKFFAVSRISNCRVGTRTFLIPADFSIKDLLGSGFGIFSKEGDFKVKLEFSEYEAPFIKERIWHESQELNLKEDGTVVLSMKVQHLFEIKKWILSFGNEVKVLSPKKLKTQIKEELDKMIQKYS